MGGGGRGQVRPPWSALNSRAGAAQAALGQLTEGAGGAAAGASTLQGRKRSVGCGVGPQESPGDKELRAESGAAGRSWVKAKAFPLHCQAVAGPPWG